MNKNKEWEKEFEGRLTNAGLSREMVIMTIIAIRSLITQAEDNMRKRCVESLPKERNLNTKFPTFGVNRENESWIRGFNVAIDQATQNINNLDKDNE